MKIIDLTLELYDGLVTSNELPEVGIKNNNSFEQKDTSNPLPKGFHSKMISFSDHSGTHVDAPSHFLENEESVENINLKKMFGDALILDVSMLKVPHEPVTKELLEEAERRQGVYVEKDDIVLIRTWERTWGEEGFFEAQALDDSAANWFIEKQIHIVGLDLPNADLNHNTESRIHQKLLSNEIYIVENLVNLEKLPKHSRFLFFGIPLKLKNATASPIRALSILDSQLI
ncbi:cyclase family protein [Peribacillus sp. TH16]|uniref:cyclase family protein n=1 Tax=Peribacillus TaxID=2675229 RepID=UPI00191190CC|nr:MULTISPECIES: cyclase family protein [unclassified Peribacillus]MBK5458124.1 cyclase family protein [Peribacillus sp. TH27]MBK5482767.1 cyclase family protein [Peribacillus sp. TH16]WMX58732.1 cyclase family protein [Peribacillus sp. R9-11]